MTGGMLVFQVLVSLGFVLLLFWAAAKFAGKSGMGGNIPGKLTVRARIGLSRSASVVIVRQGDKDLLLGVTDQNVTLLKETPAEDDPDDLSEQQTSLKDTAGSILEKLRERTARP